MSITTIGALYAIGAAVGAFRGFYYLQEHKAEIVSTVEKALNVAKVNAVATSTENTEFLNDHVMQLANATIRGAIYTTIIATHTFAWPVVSLLDIAEDAKLAFA